MPIKYSICLPCSQLNQKLRELSEGSKSDSSQAVTEPQPVQPTVSIALDIRCISISCHTLYPNT